MYMVAGTQAERAHVNNVIVMKMSNLTKTNKDDKSKDDDSEDDDSEDEDDDDKPELETAMIKHTGGVNRIRVSAWNYWTHWPLGDVAVILYVQFSNRLLWLIMLIDDFSNLELVCHYPQQIIELMKEK